MDSEKPRSLGSIATRIVCTLLGLLLLYVLGVGPAWYIAVRFPRSDPLFSRIYFPLLNAIDGTPLDQPLRSYAVWWDALARSHSQKR